MRPGAISLCPAIALSGIDPFGSPRTTRAFVEVATAVKAAGFRDAVHVQGGVTAWVNQVDPSLPVY